MATEFAVSVIFLEDTGLFPIEDLGLMGNLVLFVYIFYSSWLDFRRVRGLMGISVGFVVRVRRSLRFLGLGSSWIVVVESWFIKIFCNDY